MTPSDLFCISRQTDFLPQGPANRPIGNCCRACTLDIEDMPRCTVRTNSGTSLGSVWLHFWQPPDGSGCLPTGPGRRQLREYAPSVQRTDVDNSILGIRWWW